MGTLKQGILGGFSGKVGTVIGFTRNGISYIRGLMTSHTDANTPAQQEQRARFTLVIRFLQPMLSLLRLGFKKAGSNMSGFNAAMKYTIDNAISGIYPNLDIDYTKVLVCQGNLAGAENAAAESVVASQIDFTWDDNSLDFGAKATDKVVLVAYSPLQKKSIIAIGNATRSTGAHSMMVPESFKGEEVKTYIGFCGATTNDFSKGEYLASVLVA